MADALLFKTDVIPFLYGHLNAAGKGDFVLRPAGGTHLDTAYMTDEWKETIISVMLSNMSGVFCNEYNPTLPTSFFCFMQVYKDKTATQLKPSAMAAYPIHIALLKRTPF